MSTRSIIAATLPTGMIRAVYCHSDGYPSWNGRYLMNYWHSAGRAAMVTSLGDLSSLGKVLGKKHDFDWRSKLYLHQRAIRDEHSWEHDRYEEARDMALATGKYPQATECEDWCLAYGRDRGDPATQYGAEVNTVEELEEFQSHAYCYLWRADTWWMFVDAPGAQNDEDMWERDPDNPNDRWVRLGGVLARDARMADHTFKPWPATYLPKRSLRLWREDVTAPETRTLVTGRRALVI